jgi:hypothetical protein
VVAWRVATFRGRTPAAADGCVLAPVRPLFRPYTDGRLEIRPEIADTSYGMKTVFRVMLAAPVRSKSLYLQRQASYILVRRVAHYNVRVRG